MTQTLGKVVAVFTKYAAGVPSLQVAFLDCAFETT